jgi:hypothetical protein
MSKSTFAPDARESGSIVANSIKYLNSLLPMVLHSVIPLPRTAERPVATTVEIQIETEATMIATWTGTVMAITVMENPGANLPGFPTSSTVSVEATELSLHGIFIISNRDSELFFSKSD